MKSRRPVNSTVRRLSTMNAFSSLLSGSGTPGQQQDFARAHFPSAIANSNLQLWSLTMGIASEGTRVLVGVATWSVDDLALLDTLQATLANGKRQTTVDVFDVDKCQAPDDFDKYVPGVGRVVQTPVVGIWRGGKQIESAWGAAGRTLLAEIGLVE
jgi:hypothetical protein